MDRLLSILLLLVVALLASSLVANGQEIGTELCACSPRSFEFRLDFSLTCPPINITIGNAVEATSCLVSPFGNQNVDDLVPVSVENIDVLELGQNLRVVSQTDIDQVFNDGDTFMYTSIVADPQSIEAAGDVPRALQLNIVGINSQGDKIINVFIVTFTNGCGSYPVFEEGQSAGWARFTGLGPGMPELCSSAPQLIEAAPIEAFTPIPTSSPVASGPTDFPIHVLIPPVGVETPVESPVGAPSVPSTDAPTAGTTLSPTRTPVASGSTDFPMHSLQNEVVAEPTLAPTEAGVPDGGTTLSPTSSPVASGPTDFPMNSLQNEVPVAEPTLAPTEAGVPDGGTTLSPTSSPVASGPTDFPMHSLQNDVVVAEPTLVPTEGGVPDGGTTTSPTSSPVIVVDTTEAPTLAALETDAPSRDPETGAPTASPTLVAETDAPTKAPVTDAPTATPTTAPVVSTRAPVKLPEDVLVPTMDLEFMSMATTMSMSMSMNYAVFLQNPVEKRDFNDAFHVFHGNPVGEKREFGSVQWGRSRNLGADESIREAKHSKTHAPPIVKASKKLKRIKGDKTEKDKRAKKKFDETTNDSQTLRTSAQRLRR